MDEFQLRKVKQKDGKFPLKVSEKNLLKEHKKYIRLWGDSEYKLLQRDHVVKTIKNINEFTEKSHCFIKRSSDTKNLNILKGKDTSWYDMIAP